MRKWVSAERATRPHHDYPAWDLPLPLGTRIRSVSSGSVSAITSSGPCGNGLIVQGEDGFTYTYCHGTSVIAEEGDRLRARELIMLSGSSGRSTGPHLHLQIADGDGRLLCPQPLIEAWIASRDIGPAQADGGRVCFYVTDDPESPMTVPVHSRAGRREQTKPGAGDRKRNDSDPDRSDNEGKGKAGPGQPPQPSHSPSPTPSAPPAPSAPPSPSPTPSPTASP